MFNQVFAKNLTFYRLKADLTKKALANHVGLNSQAISNYENGKTAPDMDILKKLANSLNINVIDFLKPHNENLVFSHAEFRKQNNLSKKEQNKIKMQVEEYCNRFFCIVEIIGQDVLPPIPIIHNLKLLEDTESLAQSLRCHLNLSSDGPIPNIIELLENKGFLILLMEINNLSFSGMNGTVNNRPYILINSAMNGARMRTTLIHELAHIMFKWPKNMESKEQEQIATAIAGAFLFPYSDAKRKLGLKRSQISNDMSYICNEYGISMYLLAKRASICGIISNYAEKQFYIKANRMGWQKNEPERVAKEKTTLFEQLVCRAICEDEISLQKGVELLQIPITDLIERCQFAN